jgi:hypothetical protein
VSKLLNFTNEEILSRARSCLRDDSKYRLPYPNGGADPSAAKPYARILIDGATFNVADCIGFAVWCAGISRRFLGLGNMPPFPDTPSVSGGYINCQSMVEEARGFKRRTGQPDYVGGRFFKIVDKPVPGDFIVFSGNPHGHIGIISAAPLDPPNLKMDQDGVDNWIKADSGSKRADLQIIHCSPFNYKRTGKAVAESHALPWKGKNAHFVHFNREELLGRPVV